MLKWFKRKIAPQESTKSQTKDQASTQAYTQHKEAVTHTPHLSDCDIYERGDHAISRKNISPNALKVMSRLNQAGYQAYIVGGGVRDLLLNLDPKDFDIATDAHPEQVKQLFRNSRVIGRRFKLVHVLFGREVIEVATFRGDHPEDDADSIPTTNIKHAKSAVNSETGQIIRDNVYGTIEEDAKRRDFTFNALYYTTEGFRIFDFANGMADIDNKLVRIIGDPEQRYKEDPVRMLRAVRFAAKLDFNIEPATQAPLKALSELLWHMPAARMFDEVLKLFVSGQGLNTFDLLYEHNLFFQLFPETSRLIDDGAPFALATVEATLQNTDQRLQEGKSIAPAFLFSAMLWPHIKFLHDAHIREGSPPAVALTHAINEAIAKQCQRTSIPRRFTNVMREIIELQFKLARRHSKRAYLMFEAPRFRAAYDFVLLREQSGEDLEGLGQWWTDFQSADDTQRSEMIKVQQGTPQKKRRRKRQPHKNKSALDLHLEQKSSRTQEQPPSQHSPDEE